MGFTREKRLPEKGGRPHLFPWLRHCSINVRVTNLSDCDRSQYAEAAEREKNATKWQEYSC